MNIVRARLQTDLYDAASCASIFGACAVGNNLHVADCLDRRPDDIRSLIDEVDHIDVVVNAIQQEIVLTSRPNAVSRETAAQRVARPRLSRDDSLATTAPET